MRRRVFAMTLVLLAVLAVLGMRWYRYHQGQQLPYSSSENEADEESWEDTVLINGQKYRRRGGLRTVLILGVDKTEGTDSGGVLGNNGRADAVFLAVIDARKQSVELIQVSRDTLMDIDVYDKKGEYLYTGPSQINMQFAFGRDDKMSCNLMRKLMEKLFYDIKIDSYAMLKTEGVAKIVDRLGGVKITMPQDWTDVDPDYTEGATVVLKGAEAERFVRHRDSSEFGSNTQRMERQAAFVRAFLDSVTGAEADEARLEDALDAVDAYYQSNLPLEQLIVYAGFSFDNEMLSVPGEMRRGIVTGHDEFIPDEETLRELVIRLYYEPVS